MYQEYEIETDDSETVLNRDGTLTLPNKHLVNLSFDHLYHLNISASSEELQKHFGDVKFVCMGGTGHRMKAFAQLVATELNIKHELIDLAESSHRCSMYKVGPVLAVSHGMGVASLTVFLHEIIKLLYHAKCKNPTLLRIGTCGGIGVPKGTVVISEKAVDGLLRPFYELYIHGKVVRRPAKFNTDLVCELQEVAQSLNKPYKTVVGTTLCADGFYEDQGRLDGAICKYDVDEKRRWLEKIHHEAGVVNIEMEATAIASVCRTVGLPSAVVCVTLLDRLEGDQVESSKSELLQLQLRPQELAVAFITRRMAL